LYGLPDKWPELDSVTFKEAGVKNPALEISKAGRLALLWTTEAVLLPSVIIAHIKFAANLDQFIFKKRT